MVPGGRQIDVDWFFGEDGDPLLGRTVFGSLNWSKPNYGTGQIGEVVGAPRPYRKGDIPASATLFGFPLGSSDYYVNGAPSDLPAPGAITWYGQRAAETGGPAGIFPNVGEHGPNPTLSSSVHGVCPRFGTFATFVAWHCPWTTVVTDIGWGIWGFSSAPMFGCFPGLSTLVATPLTGTNFYLECLDYNPTTKVSHWRDTLEFNFPATEIFTLAP